MHEINYRIKELREKLGETQESFGKAIGLSKSGISNIENCSRNVTEKHIKLIITAFDVREEWLRTGKGEMLDISNKTLEVILKQNNLDDIDKKIILEYAKLKPEQRQIFKNYLKSIFYNNSNDYITEKEQNIKSVKHTLDEKYPNINRTKFDISKLPEDIQEDIIISYMEIKQTANLDNDKKMA